MPARHTAENSIAASVTKAMWHTTNINPALASAKSIAWKTLHYASYRLDCLTKVGAAYIDAQRLSSFESQT